MLGVNWRIGLPPLGIAASIFTLLDLARSDGDNSEAINYRQLYGPRELPSAPPPRFDFGPRWLTVHECSRPHSAQTNIWMSRSSVSLARSICWSRNSPPHWLQCDEGGG